MINEWDFDKRRKENGQYENEWMRGSLTSPGGNGCSIFFLPIAAMHLQCHNLTGALQLIIRFLEAKSWLFIQIFAAFFTVLVLVGHQYIFLPWLPGVQIALEYWLLCLWILISLFYKYLLFNLISWSIILGTKISLFCMFYLCLLLFRVAWKHATTLRALSTLLPKKE